jgi:phosphotransacetylase
MNSYLKQMKQNIESFNKEITIGLPDGKDQRILDAVKELEKVKNVKAVIIDKEFIDSYKDKEKVLEAFKKARKDKNTEDELKK